MTDKFLAEKSDAGQVCTWCGARFQPDEPQRRPVCERCLKLLLAAGIRDEEIFDEGKPGKVEDEG